MVSAHVAIKNESAVYLRSQQCDNAAADSNTDEDPKDCIHVHFLMWSSDLSAVGEIDLTARSHTLSAERECGAGTHVGAFDRDTGERIGRGSRAGRW
jgi:hypothetical protein